MKNYLLTLFLMTVAQQSYAQDVSCTVNTSIVTKQLNARGYPLILNSQKSFVFNNTRSDQHFTFDHEGQLQPTNDRLFYYATTSLDDPYARKFFRVRLETFPGVRVSLLTGDGNVFESRSQPSNGRIAHLYASLKDRDVLAGNGRAVTYSVSCDRP